MEYYTIMEEQNIKFEEKKSIFIASIKRVKSEESAKDFVSHITATYKDASHNVFAYIVGEDMRIIRYSDNGEPSGTAGMPILQMIKTKELKDVVIVVTRYFGGTLLGTGGLSRAYSRAASLAIDAGIIVKSVEASEIEIIIDYSQIGKLKYYLEKEKINVQNINYEEKISFEVIIKSIEFEEFQKSLVDIFSGEIVIKELHKVACIIFQDKLVKIAG